VRDYLKHIAFVGSRGYCDPKEVMDFVEEVWDREGGGFVLVSGGCPDSPDSWAEARLDLICHRTNRNPAEHKIILPYLEKHGKAGGPLRNLQIANISQEAYAFWTPGSKGTKNCIDEFIKQGKPVWVRIRKT
jgi:hypothetical protein